MFWVIFIIVLFILLIIALMFNSIIYRKNQVNNAFAGIDTMLKQRYDLIPALIDSVKGYMMHEKQLITKMTELRTNYLNQKIINDKIITSDFLTQKMKEFFVNVENYPAIKASENFLKLQSAWIEMEDNIAASRRFYNSSVNDYHNIIEMFPTNLIAKTMKLKHRNFFSIESI